MLYLSFPFTHTSLQGNSTLVILPVFYVSLTFCLFSSSFRISVFGLDYCMPWGFPSNLQQFTLEQKIFLTPLNITTTDRKNIVSTVICTVFENMYVSCKCSVMDACLLQTICCVQNWNEQIRTTHNILGERNSA